MIKTLKSFNLRGKNVLIRVDFNVPLDNYRVSNNFRIKAVVPTILTCIEAGAAVVLMSHLGRPKGIIKKELSLIPIGEELAGLLERPIKFSDDCVSMDAIDTSISLKPGEIHLLENLRFHSGEELNDEMFSSRLARHGQIYINEAFGTAHRSHASNVGVVSYFKNYGTGWLMDKELKYLFKSFHKPKLPLTLIVGGAKIDTKLQLIEKFLDIADNIIIGGGMAFTFLKASGKNIGNSLLDKSMLTVAKDIINKARIKNVKILLPSDAICVGTTKNKEKKIECQINDIPNNMMGLDIGTDTIDRFKKIISISKTVLWNGPLGVFEKKDFEFGTYAVAKYLSDRVNDGAEVIIGGGDTAAALEYFGLQKEMSHISTGGGASLELLSGNPLPALLALEK